MGNKKRTNSTINIKFNNKTQTLEEWSKELGIKYHTLYGRLFTYKMNKKEAFKKVGTMV
jgi:hypothetical protein